MDYNHQSIELKWQNIWSDRKSYTVNIDHNKPKYYVLEMLPYPSGKLHMGHVRNYSIGDALARFKRANGYNVLHPMGWDAFGLPAENAAIENDTHPAPWTIDNIATMRKELKSMGLSYDWGREISTCIPEYYKHEQAIFIDFLENGIAYQKESFVNWDPVDNTVLANEQVVDGRGWRSGAIVEKKKLRQWFLRISDFAEELLPSNAGLAKWPEAVRSIQEKWIGKSQGVLINFSIEGREDFLEVFTTRADTLFGASFIVISSHHPLVEKLTKSEELKNFISECEKIGTAEEAIEKAEKKGYLTELRVINPFTKKSLPLFIANYVLMEYGTGAVFGCPAHDERDHQFATKYNLPILPVVKAPVEWDYNLKAYNGDGIIFNSEFLNGLSIGEAKRISLQKLLELNSGKKITSYRLRDWGISRQRYWGCPIPIIYCPSCGTVPVKKSDLPVKLPEDVKFFSSGNPLALHPTWKYTKCPKCGEDAQRETDTFDTFFESSWYFMRYCSPNEENRFANDQDLNYWLPVDQYIGGIEHAAMHLLYARFFTKALKKCSQLNLDEPFDALLTQGMILHATYKDKQGKWLYPEEAKSLGNCEVGRVEKMSKSKKNTVSPEEIIKKYGSDTARFFVLSDSPPEKDLEWTDNGVEGSYKFLNRLWKYISESKFLYNRDLSFGAEQIKVRKQVHKKLEYISNNYEIMSFNVVIAGIRELVNILFSVEKSKENSALISETINIILKVLFPLTPHICEELWHFLGNNDHLDEVVWPRPDQELLVDSEVVMAVQVCGKLRATIEVSVTATKEEIEQIALQLDVIKKYISGNKIKKIIIVPGKIINIVV